MRKRINRFKGTLALIALALTIFAFPLISSAELLPSPNVDPVLGNTLLLDTSTGYEWLPAENTKGMTIQGFFESSYYTEHDFIFASNPDVQQLWGNALAQIGTIEDPAVEGAYGSYYANLLITDVLGFSRATYYFPESSIYYPGQSEELWGYTSTWYTALKEYCNGSSGYSIRALILRSNMESRYDSAFVTGDHPSTHCGVPVDRPNTGGAIWAYRINGDADGDGVPDGQDQCAGNDYSGDDDADSLCNDVDLCDLDPDNDIDSDGVCGDVDNCPLVANTNQQDTDNDSLGDECDDDKDGDTVLNDYDNCPLVANTSQDDFDEDGIGDVCDADTDNDGIGDDIDKCLKTPVGEVVNIEGCSIQQVCPCDNDWKNHGAFMRCIAHTAEDFVLHGFMTDIEKDVIVSESAMTSCGQKK